MTEPDLSIKLNSDYFLGVFIKTTLENILRKKMDIDIGADDEYTIEDQCVPYSLYLLASAISDKSSLYEGKSMAKLTGLGESKFSKDASQVIQDIFPSVDVMGNKCNTTFKFKNFYSVQYNTDYPDLSLGIIYDIIIPFLRRYPNKKNIGTTNNDYIIIPFGYNIIGLKTKVNYGHQLLMVININYLYKLKSIDFQVLTDNRQFALASNDIVGSIKKRPKKKKKSIKKQPKKKNPKKKHSKRLGKRRFNKLTL